MRQMLNTLYVDGNATNHICPMTQADIIIISPCSSQSDNMPCRDREGGGGGVCVYVCVEGGGGWLFHS